MSNKTTDDELFEKSSPSTTSSSTAAMTTPTTTTTNSTDVTTPKPSLLSTLDQLNRDDLIKKCKGLLNIAQKAKQAKNEYSDECNRLKDQLSIYETQKLADKECLKAMQEVMDSLTSAKLISATEISELKKENNKLLKAAAEHQKPVQQASITIENESLKRQLQRLTTENDGLINDLQALDDKLSQQNKDETLMRTRNQEMIGQLNEKIKQLENKLESQIDENLRIQMEYNQQKEECNNLKKEYLCQNQKLSRCTREHTVKCMEFDNLQSLYDSVRLEMDTYKMQRDELQISSASSSTDSNVIEELTHKIKSLELEQETLTINRNAKYTYSQHEIEGLKMKIDNQIDENIKLQSDYFQLKEDCNNLMKQNNKIVQQNEQLKRDYFVIEQELQQKQQRQINQECNIASNDNNKVSVVTSTDDDDDDDDEQHLEELMKTITAHKQTISELQSINSNHQNDSENQMKKLKLYKTKLIEFAQKLKHLKSSKEILLQTITEYSEALPKWQREILNVSKIIYNKINELETTNLVYVKQLDELKFENTQLQMDLQLKSNQLDALQQIENLYNTIQIERDRLLIDVHGKNEQINKMQEDTNKLHTKIDTILNDNDLLKTELVQCKMEYESELEQNTKIQEVANDHEELLCEMREINEAFKDRGDVITKQQTTITTLQNKLTNHLHKTQIDFESMVKEKDSEIERLLEINDSIDKSNNNNNANLDTTSSDAAAASTTTSLSPLQTQPPPAPSSMASTVSRARMRDIEDVFEEKYDKLRLYAMELKRKLTDQMIIIEKYEKHEEEQEDNVNVNVPSSVSAPQTQPPPEQPSSSLSPSDDQQIPPQMKIIEKKLNIQLKDLQLLQKKNDRVHDELERITDENKLLKKQNMNLNLELEKQNKELRKLESANEDLKTIAETNNKTKIALDCAIKEYLKQIQTLKQDQEQLQTKRKELENELIKLQTIIQNKDGELKLQMDEEKKLQIELTKLKASVKKTNVLNLEMEDYEKSLKDTSQKLESKIILNRELESTVKTHEDAITLYKNEIKQLEDTLNEEKLHSIELNQQIELQKVQFNEMENLKCELKLKLDESEREKNELKLQIDDLRLQLATIVGDREKICDVLRLENEQILGTKFKMEDEISKLTENVRAMELELIDTKTEYTNYKIRAQNVLRQNQTKETTRETELEEELRTVNASMENLEIKLKTLSDHHRQLQMNFTALEMDNHRVHEHCTELRQSLTESHSKIDHLQDDNRKQMQEHQETLKTQRLHMETVTQCYKKQILDLEMKYEMELSELKSILQRDDDTTMKNNLNRMAMSSTTTPSSTIGTTSTTISAMQSNDEQKINWLLMERQEGEGSECTNNASGGGGGGTSITQQRTLSSNSYSHQKNSNDLIIPLDELLNTNFEDNVILSTNNNNNNNSSNRSISPTIELQQTKDKLCGQEGRVKHLTILLSEAEQDLAKLTQLNDMLKEELRRQERSIEREKHMHNLEYLKNVMFKFLTLNSGDEKAHLVPVLNTILKLSPEETQKLQGFAKGGGDGSHRSFGSYLPSWSNHH